MIKTIENFFDESILQRLHEIVNENKLNFKRNLHWQHDLQKTPVFVLRLYSNGESRFSIERAIIDRIQKELEDHEEVVGISIHMYPPNSYIPWHNDAVYKAGFTIYMNDTWDHEKGGFFLYQNHDDPKTQIHGIIPKRNLCVIVRNGILHCTSPVWTDYEPRLALQCFVKSKTGS